MKYLTGSNAHLVIFIMVERDMCGLEWGRLYETYHVNTRFQDWV
ncbi:hypothetical protein [Phocaeicola sartorii]|nr:hypothetical protein [Phocaeicola sartorii]